MFVDNELRPHRAAFVVAEKALRKFEADLARALDRLVEARKGAPDGIPPVRQKAQEIERATLAAADALESARRAYWTHARRQVEHELASEVLPRLALIEALSRRGAYLGPGLAAHSVMGHLGAQPFAQHVDLGEQHDDIPAMPVASSVLDRADDEI